MSTEVQSGAPPAGDADALQHSGISFPLVSANVTTAEQPTAISDYELLRRIGRGAYGEVWLARNLAGSWVALKIVRRNAFDHDRPFEREFEGIKRFEPISRSDPSQVPILHVGRGEGFFYYVMELADNANAENVPHSASRAPDSYAPHTLREEIKRHGRLSVSRCVEIALALTQALAHLHRCGLVHRDVKPSNVIFVGGRPKLADIGLVTDVDATRSFVGTEGYVAPEGAGAPQADIYSLGKLLYEISTGCDRKAFPALPPDIVSRADRQGLIELNAVTMRACQFVPAQRYASAEAMHCELALLERGESVLHKRKVRRRWEIATKSLFVLIAAGLFALGAQSLRSRFFPFDPFPDGPDSTNTLANAECDKGLRLIREDLYARPEEPYRRFTNAIALDPYFARPYVGLLEMSLRETYPDAVKTMKELELDSLKENLTRLAPQLGATKIANAVVSFWHWEFPAAQQWALAATKANPNYELGHTWYGYMLMFWDRAQEGRAELEKSLKLLRSKAIIYRCIGQTYYAEGKFPEAIQWYQEAARLQPQDGSTFYWMALAYEAIGDYPRAIKAFQTSDLDGADNTSEIGQRNETLRQASTSEVAAAYWRQQWKLAEQTPKSCSTLYRRAVIKIHLGETDAALDFLEQSCAAREKGKVNRLPDLIRLLIDDSWNKVREHKTYKALLDKLGFTQMMPAARR